METPKYQYKHEQATNINYDVQHYNTLPYVKHYNTLPLNGSKNALVSDSGSDAGVTKDTRRYDYYSRANVSNMSFDRTTMSSNALQVQKKVESEHHVAAKMKMNDVHP